MRLLLLVFTVLILSIAPAVGQQSVFIPPLKNMNPDDVSTIFPDCELSADKQRMTCSFVQIRVDLVRTPAGARAELEKQMGQVTPQEMATTCATTKKEFKELLSKADTMPGQERFKAYFRRMIDLLNAICAKPGPETLRAFLWHGLEKDTKTCRIWANPWKETFINTLGKWVSNRGPTGMCGVVIVSTLDSKPLDPKKSDSPVRLWTYETQKIVTNKELGGPFCQLEESKITYSWQAKDFDRSCEFIEFGF